MRMEKRIPFSFLHDIVILRGFQKLILFLYACTKMLYLEIKYKSILSIFGG